MSAKRFRIAFSFAGEKRGFVEKAAAILARVFKKAQVLYDKYHEAEGKDPTFYLAQMRVPEEPRKTSTPNNLPRLQYFFGREAELKKIADALLPDARGWGALIDGPGGIGKTSLAIRASELTPAGRFQRIIFLSSKERELRADGQRSLGSFVLPGYLDILNAIARELDQKDVEKSQEKDRSDLILRALRDAEVLLVLAIWRRSRRSTATSFLPSSTACRAAAALSSPAADARMPVLSWCGWTSLSGLLLATSSPGSRRTISFSGKRARGTNAPFMKKLAVIRCSSAGWRANSASGAAEPLTRRSLSSAAPRRGTTRWSSSSATCWTPSLPMRPKSSRRSLTSPWPWG